MKVSLNWLNEYVPIKNIPAQQIADELTSLGLEVEGIEEVSQLKGDVVVGEVTEAKQHPDADKLRVCKVNIGQKEPLNIVCGAHNARAGIKVCVATVGSCLPGDFKIKKSKIRGVASQGMLCAADELGISDNHDEIIELDPSTALGTSVAELYGLNDTVLEIGLTPNRADCFGYLGIARELAAKLEIPLKIPNLDVLPLDEKTKSSDHLKIEVNHGEDCPRFVALYISNVEAKPSPKWLQRRLEASGMRPINTLVDITNYVMLEYSQPIHAYDVRDVKEGVLKVRRAKAEEAFTTLDGQNRKLHPDDLLICDGSGPVGLAGVMGGENSEVKQDTTSILVEVAAFNGSLIRKSAKRHGLHTEASHRFERGTDMSACETVAFRVADLIHKVAQEVGSPAPKIALDCVDHYPKPFSPGKIALRTSRAQQILGLATLTCQDMIKALESLKFTMLDKTDDGERTLYQVPTWRRDIHREIDLIEEVGRVVGFDKIPYALPMMEIGNLPENPFIAFIDRCRTSLAQLGLNETISQPFVSEKDLKSLGIDRAHAFAANLALANPLAEEEALMHPSPLISLIKAISMNRRHGTHGARLFECGRGYLTASSKAASGDWWGHLGEKPAHLTDKAQAEERASEHNYASAIIDQPWQEKSWNEPSVQNASFFHGKNLLERWLSGLTSAQVEYKPAPDDLPWLHPAASAQVMIHNTVIGYLGELHPETALNWDFPTEHTPVVFEISLERLFNQTKEPSKIVTTSYPFPPVTLDLAFIVGRDKTHDDFQKAISSFNRRKNLRSSHLFDVYQGENLPTDKKSMAYSFVFQSSKKTLNDKEVEKEVEALKGWLNESLGAELR